MNDNDIIKALECCYITNDCYACPLNQECPNGSDNIHILSLDLITRQRAEIEELHKEVMIQICKIEEERQKAIKEFAERLKQKSEADSLFDKIGSVKILLNIDVNDIDNLVKEMVGEEE